MSEIRCNNCMTIFKDEEKLVLLRDYDLSNDAGEYFKGCSKCKTDAYLMDLDSE